MGGVAFAESKTDPTLLRDETHGYFSASSTTDNLAYLLNILRDIAKIGGMNTGEYDKDWFFEPAAFALEIADTHPQDYPIKYLRHTPFCMLRAQNAKTRNFVFNKSIYPARLETKNDQYSPIDFGQFIAGMRSGILMATANILSEGQNLDQVTRISPTHKGWNADKKKQYRMILQDGDYHVNREEIEKLVATLKPLEQAGESSNPRIKKKVWTVCNLGDYVWFSRDLISYIKDDYLKNAPHDAMNEWSECLLIESISNGKISYLPQKQHPYKEHIKALNDMELRIKQTLNKELQSRVR